MSGYVASARIAARSPRLARAGRLDRAALDLAPIASGAERAVVEGDEGFVGRGIADDLAERWSAFRERWSQMTFYLFSPDSWR